MFQRKKKGFTLVEMLVVIAIIAVLVSIIIPTVGKSTTKAAAATNAANLRSVEGQLATLMVDDADMLKTSTYGAQIENLINNYDSLLTLITDTEVIVAVLQDMSLVSKIAEDMINTVTFNAIDDVITLSNGTETLEIQAPGAESLSIDGYQVAENTQMTVVVSGNNIIASYGGMGSEAFAVIAEGGSKTEINYEESPHNYWDGNNDHVCDICHDKYDHSAEEKIEGVVGGTISGNHQCSTTDTDGNHRCDIDGCTEWINVHHDATGDKNHTCDHPDCGEENVTSHTYNDDDICTECGHEKGCITPDTLITLADGSVKPIKDVTYSDMFISWNHFTGKYEVSPASTISKHEARENDVVTLYFSDGNYVEIIGEHGLFDIDENKYVFINTENVEDYVGHGFAKQAMKDYVVVTLESYEIEKRMTESYSVATAINVNAMANCMFSLSPTQNVDSEKLFSFLKMGEGLKYDEAALADDITNYGMFTYEDLAEYMTEDEYNGFMNTLGGYFKIAIGKGYLTYDELAVMLNPVGVVEK